MRSGIEWLLNMCVENDMTCRLDRRLETLDAPVIYFYSCHVLLEKIRKVGHTLRILDVFRYVRFFSFSLAWNTGTHLVC